MAHASRHGTRAFPRPPPRCPGQSQANCPCLRAQLHDVRIIAQLHAVRIIASCLCPAPQRSTPAAIAKCPGHGTAKCGGCCLGRATDWCKMQMLGPPAPQCLEMHSVVSGNLCSGLFDPGWQCLFLTRMAGAQNTCSCYGEQKTLLSCLGSYALHQRPLLKRWPFWAQVQWYARTASSDALQGYDMVPRPVLCTPLPTPLPLIAAPSLVHVYAVASSPCCV